MGKTNILIVHFNTPKLTECLVRSINKHVGADCTIYIFDNSDKKPFTYKQDNIKLLDNTKGQIIDFNKWLENYPEKTDDARQNGFGSAKHCYTVDKCFDIINDNFILMDSDILLKRNILDICDDKVMCSGEVVKQNNKIIDKLAPYLCYINVRMCKEYNIRYFNDNYMFGLHKTNKNPKCDYYDTGAWFYLATKPYPRKSFNLNDYIVHLGNASWKERQEEDEWLKKNIRLYADDKVIVSFTTYKMRTKYAPKVIDSLLTQTLKPYKICLTLYKGDLQYITPELQKRIDNKSVELIVCDEDIAPHKKYYYVMKKYKSNPIITVDDDVEYYSDLVSSLYESYLEFPDCVSARRVHKIKYDTNGKPLPYKDWFYQYTKEPKLPSFDLYATGIGGVLYPPNILDIDGMSIDLINKCLYADDVLLKYRENQLGIPVVWVKNNNLVDGKDMAEDEIVKSGLAQTNNLKNRNDVYISAMGIGKKHFAYKQRNNRVIYTCITGGYDNLKQPSCVQDDFDYVCFTDNLNQVGGTWQLRPIPEELKGLSNVKQQRCIKACPHIYLSEYDLSVWIDGSVDVRKNINQYLETNCNDKDKSIFVGKHPQRNCTYAECRACVLFKKETQENVDKLTARYRSEGLPENNGMVQTCIMIRRHNDPECKRIMDMWAYEIKNNSHRDQLSFNYVLWKLGDHTFKYLSSSLYQSEWFYWNSKHFGPKYTNTNPKSQTAGDKDLASTMKEIAEGQKEQRALTQLRDDIVSVSIKSKPKQTHNGYLSLVKRGAMKKDTRTFIQAFR